MKSDQGTHVIVLQSAISPRKENVFKYQKRILKELVSRYNTNSNKNRVEIVLNTDQRKPLKLTSTVVDRLTLQTMQPDLEKANDVAQFSLDHPLRKLVILMDSRPSEKLLRLLPSGGLTDVFLVLFGDDVLSSYEIKELEKKFKVVVVKDDDLVTRDPDDDGVVDRFNQVPLEVVDAVKSRKFVCY